MAQQQTLKLDETNKEFNFALSKAVEREGHLIVFGKAGTGKTTLVSQITKALRIKNKNFQITAFTGVASINAKGVTLNSYFGFPPVYLQAGFTSKGCKFMAELVSLDYLIIDEISTVRADMFDAINTQLQFIRGSEEPFGGVKLILLGDLHQIPPVVTKDDQRYFSRGHYFFQTESFWEIAQDVISVILQKVYRQGEDKVFIDKLNSTRDFHKLDSITCHNTMAYFNKRVLTGRSLDDKRRELMDNDGIFLCPLVKTVKRINEEYINRLLSKKEIFCATKIDDTLLEEKYENKKAKMFLANNSQQYIEIRLGAQVMFTRNNPVFGYANGMVGEVIAIDPNVSVTVRSNNIDYKVLRMRYSLILGGEAKHLFSQIPLKIAKAISIHACQGLTFTSQVLIDLSDCWRLFAHGQAYVALSRLSKIDNLFMSRELRESDIIFDETVLKFFDAIDNGE